MLPSDPLRTEWRNKLLEFGIELETIFDNSMKLSTTELETKIRILLIDAIERCLDAGYKLGAGSVHEAETGFVRMPPPVWVNTSTGEVVDPIGLTPEQKAQWDIDPKTGLPNNLSLEERRRRLAKPRTSHMQGFDLTKRASINEHAGTQTSKSNKPIGHVELTKAQQETWEANSWAEPRPFRPLENVSPAYLRQRKIDGWTNEPMTPEEENEYGPKAVEAPSRDSEER